MRCGWSVRCGWVECDVMWVECGVVWYGLLGIVARSMSQPIATLPCEFLTSI